MSQETRRTIRASAALIGTIIGAGIFGLPYVISRTGVTIGVLYFFVLGVVNVLLHDYFAQIVLAVKKPHRLPGFAGVILGRAGKDIATVFDFASGCFAAVIYIILGGIFLHLLLGPLFGGTNFMWSLLFAAIGFLVVSGGLPLIAKSEVIMTGALIVVMIFFVIIGIPKITFSNFLGINLHASLLPYGVVLFALSGLSVIPFLEDLVGDGKIKALRHSVVGGTVLATLLTAAFTMVIIGVSGASTTTDALSGLRPVYGNWIIVVGTIFGFLAVITSFFTSLANQVDTLIYDYHVPRWVARVAVVGVPLLLFLIGARDYIHVMGLAGGLIGGLTGVLLIIMYLALLKRRKAPAWRTVIPVIVAIVFFFGVIAAVSTFFNQ